jgi:hypothetical protein
VTGIVLWSLCCVAGLVALRRRLAPALLSPVVLVAGSMLLLTVSGVLLYQDVATAEGGSGIQLIISDELVVRTAHLLLLATTTFIFGSAVVALQGTAGPSSIDFRHVTASPTVLKVLAVASVLPLAYTLLPPGLSSLLRRPYYLEDAYGGGLGAVAGVLAVAAVLVLGYLAGVWGGAGRAFALALAVTYGLVFFAGGTRRLALTPLLLALGWFAANPSRRSRLGLLGAVALSLYLIRLPLYLRGLVEHGLIPYLRALPDYFANESGWDTVALNVLISFGIIGVTAYVQPHFPTDDLLVSLNPAPGGMAGWYEIAPFHRLNAFTPYGAVGELGNVGTVAVVGYFVVLGVIMAFLDRSVKAHLANGRQAAALLLVGLVAVFCLFNQQYNLRASTRLVYYAVLLDLAILAWIWFRSRPSPALTRAGAATRVQPGPVGATGERPVERGP